MVLLITIFLILLLFFIIIGLIPSLVSEEKLHELISKLYLSEESNLDKIYKELDDKKYLIKDFYINECNTLSNCNSIYYFVEPVTVIFDIDSPYSNCQTYKEFHNVDTLTLFALNGDIECQVSNRLNSKSVFIFGDTHKLKFKIQSDDPK